MYQFIIFPQNKKCRRVQEICPRTRDPKNPLEVLDPTAMSFTRPAEDLEPVAMSSTTPGLQPMTVSTRNQYKPIHSLQWDWDVSLMCAKEDANTAECTESAAAHRTQSMLLLSTRYIPTSKICKVLELQLWLSCTCWFTFITLQLLCQQNGPAHRKELGYRGSK